MKRIGLFSDTHGYLNDRIISFFENCDEIWHAGDIGSIEIADKLKLDKTFRAVYGNIDGREIRQSYPEYDVFYCEDVKVLIIHIGTYFGRYDKKAYHFIKKEQPALFVCGHSHILKIKYDKSNELLQINPGAAGNFGSHKQITAVRFLIEGKDIKDMEVLEIER